MVREGVAKGLAVAPAGVTLQQGEETDMGAKRWTKDEEAEIQKLDSEGLSAYAISLHVDRPESAIEDRLKLLQRGQPISAEVAARFVKEAAAEMVAASVGPAPAQEILPEIPPAACRLAQDLLAHAAYYALLSHIADASLAAGLDVPDKVQDAIDAEVPRVEVEELRIHNDQVVGWEVALPAGCGLRSVQVRVA